MELGEILGDALVYPFQNIKAFVIYLILGIILGIAVAGTFAGMMAGVATDNILAVIGSGIIGIIVALFLGFFISGYELDIIKYGIERSGGAPEIDFVRQFIKFLCIIKFARVFVVNSINFIFSHKHCLSINFRSS